MNSNKYKQICKLRKELNITSNHKKQLCIQKATAKGSNYDVFRFGKGRWWINEDDIPRLRAEIEGLNSTHLTTNGIADFVLKNELVNLPRFKIMQLLRNFVNRKLIKGYRNSQLGHFFIEKGEFDKAIELLKGRSKKNKKSTIKLRN